MKNNNSHPDNNPRDSHNSQTRIAIIQANWHADIVSEASKSFMEDLMGSGFSRSCFDIHDVPGSLEIPLMAQKLAQTGRYDLIMATGLIVDGGTVRGGRGTYPDGSGCPHGGERADHVNLCA